MKEYELHVKVIVQGEILPILNIYNEEHTISEQDLIHILEASCIFPRDRIVLFAKGIKAGFDYDFIASLNILVPQFENLIRHQLHLAGVQTTTIDKNNIETECGTSTLIDKPEFKEIFEKNLAFEIEALLSNKFGPNLRNNLAHGLLSPVEMQSHFSIYFWWLCLRLAYVNFVNKEIK